jgi:RNA polymerase sigma-70 factor (ECF subfamily)
MVEPEHKPASPHPRGNAVHVRTLLDRARGGDESAGGQLLSGYERYLMLLARVQVGRRVQGKVDPADLVQETFLEAHRQIKNFRGNTESELLAWLRRILAGQIALMLRRYLGTKGRDVTLERDLVGQLDESSQAMGDGLAAAGSSPSQHVAKREQAVLLAEALDKLSDSYREVIVLRHLEGLTFPQVAERMGRSEDSVQKLWVRALAGLRQQLGAGA